MPFNAKTFLIRTASAAVFVLVLLSCVWLNPISLAIFFTLVGLIGINEFYELAEKSNVHAHKIIAFILHLALTGSIFFIHRLDLHTIKPYLLILVLVCPLYMMVELFKNPLGDVAGKKTIYNIPALILSLLYVTAPCILLILISAAHKEIIEPGTYFQPQKVIGLIFFIWINDTGAYLVGSFLGKHKLYAKISPGKSWEGTIGGIILCISISFAMVQIFPQLALKHWIAISVIVAVFGTIGDLVESMLKRIAGVKDSGNIMPGHGGVLDRFDSLIFTVPFVFVYLAATGNL